MSNKQILLLLLAFFIVIGVIGTTVYLTRQRQDTQSGAQTPGEACTVPAPVQNVLITYPHCDASNNCSLTQANCTWSAVDGATGYQMTVTETDSNTIVKTEAVTGTSSIFDVTQGKTYQCDVQAVNSCGESGPAGSHTLLCEVDALVASPSPTPVVTTPPTLTPTLPPGITPITYVSAPPPTLPPAGITDNTTLIGAGAALFIFAGAALLFIL
jgi:hypothetical protein